MSRRALGADPSKPHSCNAYSEPIDAGPFFDADRFPQLAPLTAAWPAIRDEALTTITAMRRNAAGDWSLLPFALEPDDLLVIPQSVCDANRLLAPLTVALVEGIGPVEAYSFSSLAAGAEIPDHDHRPRLVSAALCLAGGADASITVAGETRAYADGSWLLFDYTQRHRVSNAGPGSRLVLLVILSRDD